MSFDRDLKRKEQAKYDDRFLEMEMEASDWIAEVLGHPLPSTGGDLCDTLHDGVILCELANRVSPNSARCKKSSMPFVQMENISQFLSFCAKLGIPQHDLFQTIDLYAVQQGGLDARYLGPKMSTSTSRTFTKEQMNEAKNHVNTYQYGKFSGSTNVLFATRRDPAGHFH